MAIMRVKTSDVKLFMADSMAFGESELLASLKRGSSSNVVARLARGR